MKREREAEEEGEESCSGRLGLGVADSVRYATPLYIKISPRVTIRALHIGQLTIV